MKLRAAIIAATLGLAASAPALAQQQAPWYVGLSIGQAQWKDACNGSPISCDDKDTAWRLFGGYMVNRNFGVELGYADLGKATANGTLSGVSVDASLEATAWDLSAIGALPFGNNFSVFGRLGVYRANTKAHATGTLGGLSATASGEDNNNDLTFGVGLTYEFTRNLGLRGEWQRYKDVGGDNTTGTEKTDIDVLSIGLHYRF